jgi:hypothetical protein
MNFNDGTEIRDLNKSTTAVDASHESGDTTDIPDGEQTKHEHLDAIAMQGAKRAQNRIHSDEQEIPGSTLFTK